MGGAVRVLGAVRAVGVVGVVWVVRVRAVRARIGSLVRARIGSLEILSKHIHKPLKVLEAV